MRNGLDDGTITLSGISGCLWGFVGCWLLSDGSMDARALGGLAVSPLIGIAVGVSSRALRSAPWWKRALFAIPTLCLASFAFVIASAIWFELFGAPRFTGPAHPTEMMLLLRIISILPFLVVFLSWLVGLWPVAIVNHHVIWYLTRSPDDTGPLALDLRR
jgi:hypothetical protein